MKTFMCVQALLLLLYIVGTNGRHVDKNENEEISEAEEETDLLNRAKDHAIQPRHRRRSRQSHGGYDYPPPFYYDNRRDYNTRQQDELLSRILKSLDEIISYIRRPAPPQPIYIPYPVIQYIPSGSCSRPGQGQNVPVITETTTQIPSVTDRFPVVEDENQIWGIPIEPEVPEEEGDGSRPINLVPAKPPRPISRPMPPVEHGSSQAGVEQTTTASIRRPGACETAILTCCSIKERTAQRNCFARYDCSRTYATNRACDPAVIKRVLEHFTSAYAPIKN